MARERKEEGRKRPYRLAATSLIFIGLVIGLAAGLYYAWIVDPIIFVDASPARLSPEEKETYIILVSQSYAANGDWQRTQQRLAALDDPAIRQTVTELLERYVREQKPPALLQDLAALAQQLGGEGRAIALFAPTPLPGAATATPTATAPAQPTATPTLPVSPTPTATLLPSPTPTSTLPPTSLPSPTTQPVYRLLQQERVCADESAPRLEVLTWDALLEPQPGVEVIVRWQTGEDRFYTGFQPGRGPDYGDFTMEPGVTYAVQLAAGSPEITGLRVEECDSGLPGGWRLTFQNLQLTPEETPTLAN